MEEPENFDLDAADKRVGHMLQVLSPHTDEVRALLEAHRNAFLNMPVVDHVESEDRQQAWADPDSFMSGMLMAFCMTIAYAEQDTETHYTDEKLFTKLKEDISDDTQIMRNVASANRTR